MTKKEYNGWYNYETWLFNLHYDGLFSDDAKMFYDDAEASRTFTKAEQAALDLSGSIEAFADDVLSENEPVSPFIQDMLRGAMQEVNFHEVAKHYISNVEQELAA